MRIEAHHATPPTPHPAPAHHSKATPAAAHATADVVDLSAAGQAVAQRDQLATLAPRAEKKQSAVYDTWSRERDYQRRFADAVAKERGRDDGTAAKMNATSAQIFERKLEAQGIYAPVRPPERIDV